MSEEIVYIDINKLEKPVHVLRDEEDAELQELMSSLSQVKMLQPIIVRKIDSKYRIIAGYRRYLAAKRLGWDKVPCRIITNIDDVTEKVLLLTENIQRRDVNPFQLARVIIDLIENHKLTIDDVATRLGKSKSYVSKLYALRKLPPSLFEWGLKGKLDYEVGYELTRIEDPGRQYYYAQIIREQRMNRHSAIEWIRAMESIRESYEQALEKAEEMSEEEGGEFLRGTATEEFIEKKPESVMQCIVCGRKRPSDMIKTYFPICQDCLHHCLICRSETSRIRLITICEDCLKTILEAIYRHAEEAKKELKVSESNEE